MTCPRVFEVEAIRDGRLSGNDRIRFERHLASCSDCANEARALEELAASASASIRSRGERDELHVRRERTRLLAAYDDALVGEKKKPAPPWLWGLAAALLLASAVVMWRATRPRAPASSAALDIVVQAVGSAEYVKRVEGERERIVLERGSLRIQVAHRSSSDARLLVTLPDGELEDVGTTFRVTAANGRTTFVSVEEGSVVLRLRERPPIVLHANEAWSIDARPSADSSVAASASAPSAPPVEAPTTPPAPRSSAVRITDPAKEFRDATTVMNAGDHRRAASLFAAFVATHPDDARAEDAAYLRVVALHRAGAETERREAAHAYLAAYPNGFRRAEVEKLAE